MLKDAAVMPMLPVKDLDAARNFYEGTLGLKRVSEEQGQVLIYESGRTVVCVYRSDYAGTNKGTAASWEVNDVEAEVKELNAHGVTFEKYDNMPGITREGNIHRAGDFKVAWFKDPSGNILAIQSTRVRATRK